MGLRSNERTRTLSEAGSDFRRGKNLCSFAWRACAVRPNCLGLSRVLTYRGGRYSD